uniref:Uncharacterized protein n=1 Tax=Picea sitchensis TaxID=3332 RepID=A0A6B9XR60_PICSI|nr:hypothetical protein Q903MT_gene4112 [Picea sitchensis]
MSQVSMYGINGMVNCMVFGWLAWLSGFSSSLPPDQVWVSHFKVRRMIDEKMIRDKGMQQ